MTRFFKFSRVFLICAVVVSGSIIGCSPKPSSEEMGQLEQAKAAAESAETKLHELRQERIQLEGELQEKQAELQNDSKENESLK